MNEPSQLGAFYHHVSLLAFTETNAGRAARECMAEGRPPPANVRQDLAVAFEVGAYMHELQHFADVFGTAAGTSLVANGLRWTRSFAEVCDHAVLKRSSNSAWTGDPAWSARKADVLRGFRFALAAERAFSRPFEPFAPHDHTDELFVDVGHPSDGSPSRRTLNGVRQTVIEPLGFEAFTEASAHAHTRSFVDSGFPELASDGEFRVRLIEPDADPATGSPPYMTVDLLVSRWFRSHGIETFPRRIVHQMAERVLGGASFHFGDVTERGVAVPMRPAGMELRRLLDGLDPHQILEDGVGKDPDTSRAYIETADRFDAGEDWQTVEDLPFGRAIRIWETWIAKHVTSPLLRLRASTDGSLFETSGAVTAIAKLVPATVRNGSIVAMTMPGEVRSAWCTTVFITSVLHQLALDGVAHCPRRFDLVPGLKSVANLARQGTCDANAELGCGSTAGWLRDGQFRCLFEDVVVNAGARAMPRR